jgi:16S rRNA (guanine527-N7)-methyltransferase
MAPLTVVNKCDQKEYHCETMAGSVDALLLRALVLRALSMRGTSHQEGGRADVERWLDLLQTWNARTDLTAARSAEELVDLMIADALVLADHVDRGVRVVDVGTGAGAPGLGLAILRPDLCVTLVEPNAKRASFLRLALGSLSRDHVAIERVRGGITIERARGEALRDRRAWDVALSRATFPPEAWLDLAVTLTASGGAAWVFLAKDKPPVHPQARLAEVIPYSWPLTGAARTLARYVVT